MKGFFKINKQTKAELSKGKNATFFIETGV